MLSTPDRDAIDASMRDTVPLPAAMALGDQALKEPNLLFLFRNAPISRSEFRFECDVAWR